MVSNVFGDDNRGGAAITAATVETVKRAFPSSKVTLLAVESTAEDLCTTHRHTLAAFPDAELLAAPFRVSRRRLGGARAALRTLLWLLRPSARSLPTALQRVRDADLVVSKGGYVFVQRTGMRGLLSLWMTAFPLTYAWRLGIPTVAFATSIGPFRDAPSRWLNRFLLRRLSLVLPRDERAYRAARQLGVPAYRLEQVPDSAFARLPPSADAVDAARSRHTAGRRYAAVTVRLQSEGDPLLEELSATICALLARRAVERVLVVDQVRSDAPGSALLVGRVDDPRVTHVDADLSPSQLVELYGGAEVVIACRLHSAIFAMVAGTPVVAISIDGTKTEGVFESVGLGRAVVARSEASADRLMAMLDELIAGGPEQRRVVACSVEPARATARSLHTRLHRAVQQT